MIRLSSSGIFLSLLLTMLAFHAMEPEHKITLSDPYCHDQLSFKVDGLIELAQDAKIGFGSPALIERLNYAGIKTFPGDLLVPVKILITDRKTPPVDWTQETPFCIKKPILETATTEIQTIKNMLPESSCKIGIKERRESAIRKDALDKIKDLVFPPALPVRHLEATHYLSAKAFDECIYYRLSFDNHAELNTLSKTQTFDILSIHDRDIQEKIQSVNCLQRRPVQNNDDNDDESLEEHINKLEVDIEEACTENIYGAFEYLEDNGIITHNNSVIAEETHQPELIITPSFVAYTNSTVISGPRAQTDSRERSLNHHHIKRPFDLVRNRQIAHQPQSKKRRLL